MIRGYKWVTGFICCTIITANATNIKRYGPQLTKAIIITIPRHSADFAVDKIIQWIEKEKFLANIEVPGQNINLKMSLDHPELAEIRSMMLYGTLLGLVPKINDPHFNISLSKSMLSLNFDNKLSSFSWGKAIQSTEVEGEDIQGVVFSSKLYIKTLKLKLDKIEIIDRNNPLFGTWDLQEVTLKNRTMTGVPMVIDSKFFVYVDKHSKIRTKIMTINSNIKDVRFLLNISELNIKNLPGVMNPNYKQPIETLITAAQDPILMALTQKLEKTFTEIVPSLANEYAKKIETMATYETHDYPPQSPELKQEELLHIKFQPTEIRIDENSQLKLTIGSTIGDPIKSIYLMNFKNLNYSNEILKNDQDMLIELNPDYMNQLLHQSYWRGYYAPISAKGFELSFFDEPEFFVSSGGELRINSEMSLKKPHLIFGAQLNANFIKNSNGKIQLFATGIVKNSYADKVSEGGFLDWTGKKILNLLNTRLKNEPYLLQDGLPLPKNIGPLVVNYTDFNYQTYQSKGFNFNETGTIKIYTRIK